MVDHQPEWEPEVKRFLPCTVLVFAGWLTVSVTWAAAARLAGLPGPADAAAASIEAATDGLESLRLPPPLAAPRRAVTRGMRAGGRAVTRLYAVPERIAARLVRNRDRGSAGIEPFASRALAPGLRIRAELAPERAHRVRLNVSVPRGPTAGSGERMERMDRVHERLERVRERLDRAEARIEMRVIEVRPGG